MKRKRHSPEQVIRKLRDAARMMPALSSRIFGNQKAEMMGGMDQREIIPLLFRESAEKGMRERRGRHCLKSRDFAAELLDGNGLVMSGSGEPPLGNLDARLHSSLAKDTLQDHGAQEFADDPGCPVIVASMGRS